MKKIKYDWKYIEDSCRYIANKCKDMDIDIIVGIKRGGFIPAVIISHLLDKPIRSSLGECYYHEKILLVDDISDSGETFIRYIKDDTELQIITSSIHVNINTSFIPDIYYEKITDWAVYPWETEKTSRKDS